MKKAAVAEARFRVLPNLGAEEGPDWPKHAALAAVAETTRLWRLLFPADHAVVGPSADSTSGPLVWPQGLGPQPPGAAFRWIDDSPGTHPWLADDTGDAAAATAAVHDKAFSFEAAVELGYEPRALRGLSACFDAALLGDAERALDQIERRLGEWPTWTAGRFVLKPRFGSSGRGRVSGTIAELDRAAVARNLPRLAARGGAILEPWLDRVADLSAGLYLDGRVAGEGDALTLLGCLEAINSDAGVPIGHMGEVDSRGRVFSGRRYEEELREAAATLARRAQGLGYAGPCGLDALIFRMDDAEAEPRFVLRPVVEFNARFTLGIVAIGLVRRALARVKQALDLAPGERRGFVFALSPPAGLGHWSAALEAVADDALLVDLSADGSGRGPALLFAASRAAIEPIVSKEAATLRS